MKIILFSVGLLSLAALQVSGNEVLVRALLNAKTGLVSQMEHQIAQGRAVISSTVTGEFNNFIADIQEAHQFARKETGSFAEYMSAISDEECLSGIPITIQQILEMSDEFLSQCVESVIEQGEELEQKYQAVLEDYRVNATAYNLAFARDYFKSPEKVFTQSLYEEAFRRNQQEAILWDNVHSLSLYAMRQEPRGELQVLNDSLYTCIMDMKEFIGTKIGSIFLYFWKC